MDQLDSDILGKLPEADDIASSDEFKEGMYAALVKIDAFLVPTTPVAPAVVPAGGKVKLPKLVLNVHTL